VEIVPGVGVPMTIAEKVIERAKFENWGVVGGEMIHLKKMVNNLVSLG